MSFADQLTLARIAAVPFVVLLYAVDFYGHNYWATALFVLAMTTDWFDGRVARRYGRTSQLGSLLDPVADKILVISVLVVLIDQGVFPGWMVAAIVAREFLVSGLRLAALERGVVMQARDLGKLKTWSQALAAAIGGFAAAGALTVFAGAATFTGAGDALTASPRRDWKSSAIGDGWIVVRHPDLDGAIAIGNAFASELRIVTG